MISLHESQVPVTIGKLLDGEGSEYGTFKQTKNEKIHCVKLARRKVSAPLRVSSQGPFLLIKGITRKGRSRKQERTRTQT